LNYYLCLHHILYQKLKAATIDHIPDALLISKRRDREPLPPASGPVSQATPSSTHLVANTTTTNSSMMNSQGFTHPGYAMHGLPSFSPPAFPMQTYPIPNYMPAPMYAPQYGYQFAPQGAQAMQPNGFPAPAFMMQNYPPPMPNYPMPAQMYAPPSAGYPFAMPAPQGANFDYASGRKRQHSLSDYGCKRHHDYPPNSDPAQIDEMVIPPDPSLGPPLDWITDTLAPVDTPE
jgi:hypothetical protein